MRFLVDAQLPAKICEILQSIEFDAIHVDSPPKGDESTDKEISIYANQHDYIVISKDSDCYHSHMILGQPKKLMLLTTGNIKNRELFDNIRANASIIKEMFIDCNYVEVSNNIIIGH